MLPVEAGALHLQSCTSQDWKERVNEILKKLPNVAGPNPDGPDVEKSQNALVPQPVCIQP